MKGISAAAVSGSTIQFIIDDDKAIKSWAGQRRPMPYDLCISEVEILLQHSATGTCWLIVNGYTLFDLL